MLVLTRRKSQTIVVDGPCTITVVECKGGDRCRIGVEAARDVLVLRGELEPEAPANGAAEGGRDE